MEPRQNKPTGRAASIKGLDRFQRRARLVDLAMKRFIPIGGLGVLLSLFGIFLFVLLNALPLFQKAKVTELAAFNTGVEGALLLGVDEENEWAFILTQSGVLEIQNLATRAPSRSIDLPLSSTQTISSVDYEQRSQTLTLGLSDGSVMQSTVVFPRDRFPATQSAPPPELVWNPPPISTTSTTPVKSVDTYFGETHKAVATLQQVKPSGHIIHASVWERFDPLFGESEYRMASRETLHLEGSSEPLDLFLGANAETLVIRMSDDTLRHYVFQEKGWKHIQSIRPFTESGGQITSIGFTQGRVSLSLISDQGDHEIYSLTRQPDAKLRQFMLTKRLPPLDGPGIATAASLRNKALLVATKHSLSLRYMTTGKERWQRDWDSPLQEVLISSRYDRMFALDSDAVLHVFALEDPHPEAGLKAFFGKIWYEGQDRPRYLWQSSGGSDSFEPKLSLVPLLFGSLKGTLYALLFAIPVAIMGAIYTSQFLHPRAKNIIKPMIEIMASIPSVVLGFIAALWLAPLIDDKVPAVLLSCLFIPGSALMAAFAWKHLPIKWRWHMPEGSEFALILPAMACALLLAWQLGPLFEQIAFRFTDPATGATYADFRIWWENWNGSQFQQRNAMVVGFIMGFAVIPIIFSISEDALSSVPRSLVSASLALGANRWQTTARIILPSAAAGILSAVMIGLGRAVGETMIVVMATGNTPILDVDLFSGMRALSATIAVELPEAPSGGTLYRSLFLGALVLFLLTFAVNTVAEILRARIRKRFKVITT